MRNLQSGRRCRACARGALAAVLVAAALWAAPVLAGDKGQAVHVCTCLGNAQRAEELAAQYREAVPGLEVEVRERAMDGRTVREIWVRHPEKTPEDLCRGIGRRGCLAPRHESGCEPPD